MHANTFVGQVIAVLSRRASAFELDSAEPQTFPGRLWALLSRRRCTNPVSLTPTGAVRLSGAGELNMLPGLRRLGEAETEHRAVLQIQQRASGREPA